ncbi:SIMPL domain-containing protein [Sphingomonas sp. dw_22]|uniref:SIMPL domain-containing protein n=1 Tax=Sphingomonas sp. dw_22 TaxID=2721175 RepID=UPI001BD25FC3|nr:SIMPL domain-containing protein [Sphingomonas sp. dw_22]
MIRYALALALLAAPTTAFAQAGPEQGPVTVEIVAAGQVKIPAQRFRFSVDLKAKGEDEAAASAALAANRARLVRALAAANIREAQAVAGAPNSIMGLLAGLAGRSKPSFSFDSLGNGDGEKPQSTATEKLMFDAPSRAAALAAKRTVEDAGGKVDDDVIALLDDYTGPTRRAKADAIAKARAEAAAYGETLGLRHAAITKVSEKQDPVAGSLGFITQLIGMFGAKGGSQSDDVVVPANLTVEFQLSR